MTNPIPIMRSYLTCYTAAIALSLNAAAATSAGAQSKPSSFTLSKDCEKALRLAVRGHLRPEENEAWDREKGPTRSKTDRMWELLPHCGAAGGVAAGAAWSRTRTLSDTTRLADAYGRLWSFRDASVFDAAAALAADPSATSQSRVFSTMLLLAQLFDHLYPEYGEFISTGFYDICRIGGVAGRTIVMGVPLPADARVRARTLARAVAADAGAPRDVQSAGRCLDQAIDIQERVQAAGPITPPGQ